MEDQKKYNITLPEGCKEVIIREGSAEQILNPKAPLKLNIHGTINSVWEFIKKRLADKDQINILRTMIVIDREDVSITLITNENDEYQRGIIEGSLQKHPKFVEFGINEPTRWSPNELGLFLKMNRAYFESKEANMKLVTSLRDFTGNINAIIEKQRLANGSFKDNCSAVVSSNLPESFMVNIPIFKGQTPQSIEVEFESASNGSEIILQLVSPGACQTFEEIRDKAIDEQINAIQLLAPGIAIIEK